MKGNPRINKKMIPKKIKYIGTFSFYTFEPTFLQVSNEGKLVHASFIHLLNPEEGKIMRNVGSKV